MKWIVPALVSLALVSGACAPNTERGVLRAPPRPDRAAGEGALALKNEAALVGTRIRHGFIGEGEAHIAYTVIEAGPRNRPFFVHCSGGRGDRYNSGVIYASKVLHWGDVLLFDYPGYGDSSGVANEESFNAMTGPVGVLATSEARGRPLIFWGHSLGGAVCASMAGRTPAARAMIFEASARNLGDARASASGARFDALEALKPMQGPVLILAGALDQTIPVRRSRSFAAAARDSRQDVAYVEFPDADHTDIPLARGFEARVTEFVARVRAPNASSSSLYSADQGLSR
jgi:pimeloyl-ACP methyl ester carboxylesterase